VKPWTAEEARQFLESAKRDQDPLYAAYVLILVMGLRKGEVVGLPWSAVNLDRGELDIGWQLQRVRRQLLHRETKTEASEATLPMPGICVTALRIREKDQAAAKAAAGASWTQSGLVFTTRAGTPFEPRNLNRRFETRCAKAGIRRITVHDMRHTCATLLAALDVHPRVVMRILRHAQIDVTMNVYTEVSNAKTLKALKRLGRQLARSRCCTLYGIEKATSRCGEWPMSWVGVAGFEPAASSSRTKRAAKLRYTPPARNLFDAARDFDSLAETRPCSRIPASTPGPSTTGPSTTGPARQGPAPRG